MIDDTDSVFVEVRIIWTDGRVETIRPEKGQHLVLMGWKESLVENEEDRPGVLLTHTDMGVCARMIDKLIAKFPKVWENIVILWMNEKKLEDMMASRKVNKEEPSPSKWN